MDTLPAFSAVDLEGHPVTHEIVQQAAPAFIVLLRGLQ